MSHYSTSPRKNYVVIHHTGGPNNHTIETNAFCNFDDGNYDFAVTRLGRIFVCSDSDGVLWRRRTGEHALGCNCRAVGIVMHGCFGGCTSGNVSAPSVSQECSVAFLMSHLGTPVNPEHVLPHAHCRSWSERCGAGGGTVCPGTRFTSGSNWNSNGRTFRDRLRTRRRNWDQYQCCFSDPVQCLP